MSLSLASTTGRYATFLVGVLGLFTSVQIACTFSDDPPSPKKSNPVTDSGPDKSASSSSGGGATSSSGSSGYGYYGYGYGYGPDGCYGYGYGYAPSYSGYVTGCD